MNIVNVGYHSANYYVLEGSQARLLIDVGWPGTLPELLANLKRKSLVLSDIGFLFVTHYHPDHAGLAQELKDRGLKHMILEQQLPFLPQMKTYMKPASGYVEIQTRDSLVLSTAQSRAWLAKMGLQGEMVHTPGHSDDSISLVLDEGIAFTGDLLPPSLANEGQAKTIQASWNRLRALHVRSIYPGHGPVRPIPPLP